jgi:hypothetical protein
VTGVRIANYYPKPTAEAYQAAVDKYTRSMKALADSLGLPNDLCDQATTDAIIERAAKRYANDEFPSLAEPNGDLL